MHKGTSALASQNAVVFFTVLLLCRRERLESPCSLQRSPLESSRVPLHRVAPGGDAIFPPQPIRVPDRRHLPLKTEPVWPPGDYGLGSPLLRLLWRM